MTLARADVRFLLPHTVRSACVYDDPGGWNAALERAGVELVRHADGADLLVAPAARWREAAGSGARGLVLEGPDQRGPLRGVGLTARAHLPAPSAADPTVLLPLDAQRAVRYALTRMVAPPTRLKALRNRVLAAAMTPSVRVAGARLVTTACERDGGPPLVRAAQEQLAAGVPLDWILQPGRGDLLARCVLHLFPPGADVPHWAVKFARVRGYSDPFDRDEAGHEVAARAGTVVTAHAPTPLGRLVVDGHHAAIETAAPGMTLAAYLHGRDPRRRKLARLEEIAAWLVDVAVGTAAPPPALAPELERLGREVVPGWRGLGGALDPAAELDGLPAAMQHNDLGTWNVVVERGGFTALDWEAARPHGLPLWDLLYLMTDALAHLDGTPTTVADRERHFVRLYRGELGSSAVLFRWVAETVRRLELPRDSIGRLASLCWMHHGLSPAARQAAVDEQGDAAPPAFWLQLIERLGRRWLTDPALGLGWSRWQTP